MKDSIYEFVMMSAKSDPAPSTKISSTLMFTDQASPAIVSSRISSRKVKLVAELLGLSEDDEEALLAKLIDKFLAMKGAA
ncbi:MAG: hypothetical protein ABIG35_18060 [Pseudomonadota bacterium]